MSQTILLVDYEPRTVARVQEALAPLGANVLVAKDVDAAVAECSKIEPRVVLITSVLPRVSVEDAITQLRARAGLRTTPFLILTSGYSGDDTRADAARLGAMDLVIKPFSSEALLEQIRTALQAPRTSPSQGAESRADVIEALRRSAGILDGGTVTSEDIFGDLLESEPAPKPAPAPPVAPTPPLPVRVPEPPRPMKSAAAELSVDKVLESTLAEMRGGPAKPARPKETSSGTSVDDLLSQTLSGLKVQIPRGAEAAPPAMPTGAETRPAPPEAPKPEPAKTVAIPLREIPIAPAKPARPTPEHAQGPLPGGSPFGQYELMQLIATGGMAEVYKARMRGVEGFQKIVAIKRILPHLTDNDEFVTMFVDEAKLAAQLQHPNIIHIYDLGKIERSYYIAMEYIDGKDLRSILKLLGERRTRMPLGHALFIASKLAAALDYAHRKHDLSGRAMALVHRDVSPQNVLISFDGEVKLCDFGIAKAASKASHTRAGALKGKLQYMSPEQAWGKDIDHRSDIFSLGLVLYEMATGRKAFAGDSELSILEQVRTPKLVPPRDIEPSIPPQVERLILKALKEQREDRYETAGELASEIDELMQNLRPAPSAPDLGGFLTELFGRAEVPVPKQPATKPAAPPLPEIHAPTEVPAKVEEPVVAAAARDEAGHAGEAIAPLPVAVAAPPRRPPMTLLAGLGVVVIAALAGALLMTRGKPGEAPAPTPAAEGGEATRQLIAEEVARQQGSAQQQPATDATGATAPVAQAMPEPARSAVPPTPRPQPTRRTEAAEPVVTAAPEPAIEPTQAAPEQPTAAPPPTEAPPPEPTRAMPTPAPAAQAPTVREGDLVDIGEVDTPPEPLSIVKAAYPPLAARQRLGGIVILRALVNENGGVDEVVVLRGIKPDLGLDRAASDALRRWRFKPATKNGVRVKVWHTQSIPFQP